MERPDSPKEDKEQIIERDLMMMEIALESRLRGLCGPSFTEDEGFFFPSTPPINQDRPYLEKSK